MTKPIAVTVDAERAMVALLTPRLAARGEDVTCGVDLPTVWAAKTKPHVQIALNGTPEGTYPVTAAATIRITVWATKTTDAKRLCALAQGVALAYGGGGGIQSIRFLTGVLPTTDPATKAELATSTVRVNLAYSAA